MLLYEDMIVVSKPFLGSPKGWKTTDAARRCAPYQPIHIGHDIVFAVTRCYCVISKIEDWSNPLMIN